MKTKQNQTLRTKLVLGLVAISLNFNCATCIRAADNSSPLPKIIFDTDMGNDVDDALALGLLHSLQTRGACEILGVTTTRCDELAGPFVNAVNTFYGQPDLLVGCIRGTPEREASKYLPLVEIKDGATFRYPHKLKRSSDAPDALKLLRRLLAAQPDGSVTLVQVGYFSNFAALLDTPPDELSPLKGIDLVRQKVKLLSVMAGAFQTIEDNNHFPEFNVYTDVSAAKKLAREWPTPIVWSGFEIGIALPYPAVSVERDYAYEAHHPLAESYFAYMPPPHERPTWDLTSALYAVHPDRGYFGLSARGRVVVEDDGRTRFTPQADGRDRFLKLDAAQIARTREALVQLCTQPPKAAAK